VQAANEVTSGAFAVPFAVDTTPPRVRAVSLRPFVLDVSEPASLRIRVDGQLERRTVRRPGRIRVRLVHPLRRAVVSAQDAAGNLSAPLVVRRKVAKPGQ
jgi:hypothetical protein